MSDGTTTMNGSFSDRTSAAAAAADRLTCGVCGQTYDEPRLLPCLHAFCTRCIEGLDSYSPKKSKKSDQHDAVKHKHQHQHQHHQQEQKINSLGSKMSNKDSSASGYETDKSPSPVLNCSFERTNDLFKTALAAASAARTVLCPKCDSQVELPPDGASHLPLHYTLQNKLLQMSLDGGGFGCTRIERITMLAERTACELCIGDVSAIAWCPECCLSLCGFCSEAHKRQRRTEGHRTCPLHEALHNGLLIERRRLRQQCRRRHSTSTASSPTSIRCPVCAVHPTEELALFCKQCNSTACRDCFTPLGRHAGHARCPVSEVAESKVAELRSLLEKTLPKMDAVRKSLAGVRATAKRIQAREIEVANEIDDHFDRYVEAVEERRRNLKSNLLKTCECKQRILKLQSVPLEEALDDLETSRDFVQQLLADGSDVEILTLLGHVGRRIHELVKENRRLEPRIDHFLQFIADEVPDRGPRPRDGRVGCFQINGNLATQRIAPQNCIIKGIPTVKQGKKADILLLTKDIEGQMMRRGGANVKAELISKDFSDRTIPVKITDRNDGTYQLTIKPEISGLFWLSVEIHNKQVQGSPYPMPVKATLNAHSGIYHCCSFCSSGGSKDATCSCRGTMPGGFKGCGHGHEGHPGKRHWSCCGQLEESTQCTRASAKILQFTL